MDWIHDMGKILPQSHMEKSLHLKSSIERTAVLHSCNNSDNVKHRDDIHGSHSDNEEISNAELGLAEDHFSLPEGHFGLSTLEELEMAIESCKDIILEAPEKSEKMKNYVKKLVHLRMELQKLKEGPEIIPPDVSLVLGHRFEKMQVKRLKVKRFCEKCTGNIFGVVHNWYQCQECGFSCHGKCLNLIKRVCANVKVTENPSYILNICPESGLSSQNFRCAECHSPVMHKEQYIEPRLCDYNGQYYCPNCHWNSQMVIPARVLHNWDFEPRKVCRASKQFLQLMKRKAIINVNNINPMLFTFVEELRLVKKLREDILIMKKYFLACKAALKSKLLLQLSHRQHFVDSAEIYSLQDLCDIQSGVLLEFLNTVHSNFVKHIKEECQACQGKGFICELCNTTDIIYSFDANTTVCSTCLIVLHTECYYKKDQTCPKCQRLAEKMPV